jgi:hypothetical protein
LHLGRLIATGPPAEVAQSQGLREAYFGKSHARDYQTRGEIRRLSGALGG